ncbi:hypothetical protein ACWD44_06970 [Streptomyces albidoflavus]|uniref:hypothetical protein n=1 Tax=Streptomyces albidoflavus TaxID=1886 RepID=UPI00332E7E3A
MTSLWVPESANDEANERAKTVYATYGVAMYLAACLEADLVHAFALHKILDAKESAELIADPWHAGYKKNLVKLISHVEDRSPTDPKLVDDLTECRKRRNLLAHSYWRDHDEDLCSKAGELKMIRGLEADIEFFQAVRDRLNEVVADPAHQQLGFTPEQFDAEFRRLYRKANGE